MGGHFRRWAVCHGVSVTPHTLPWFQLAVVPLANIPFIASSTRAYSLLQQAFLAALPAACCSNTWPEWHTLAYRDQHGHAYFSPSLVRRGVLTLTHLRSLGDFPRCMPPTWEPRYRTALAPASSAGEFTRDLVSSWGTTSTMRVLMTASSDEGRLPGETWGYFNSLRLEGALRDFLRSAIWKKLPVGVRIRVWVPHTRRYPLCGDVETHERAISACSNLGLAAAFITQLRLRGLRLI